MPGKEYPNEPGCTLLASVEKIERGCGISAINPLPAALLLNDNADKIDCNYEVTRYNMMAGGKRRWLQSPPINHLSDKQATRYYAVMSLSTLNLSGSNLFLAEYKTVLKGCLTSKRIPRSIRPKSPATKPNNNTSKKVALM